MPAMIDRTHETRETERFHGRHPLMAIIGARMVETFFNP
jgi:hypothetical protein